MINNNNRKCLLFNMTLYQLYGDVAKHTLQQYFMPTTCNTTSQGTPLYNYRALLANMATFLLNLATFRLPVGSD